MYEDKVGNEVPFYAKIKINTRLFFPADLVTTRSVTVTVEAK